MQSVERSMHIAEEMIEKEKRRSQKNKVGGERVAKQQTERVHFVCTICWQR